MEAMSLVDSLPTAVNLGEWRNIGPSNYGGKVHDIAVDPQNYNIVFAAYGEGGGLWRTLDGGRTWNPIHDRSRNNCVISVKIHPTQPGMVAAGLKDKSYNRDRGVLLSRDGGETWQAIGPAHDQKLSVVEVAFSPNDPNVIYAATQKGLYKTVNSGGSWSKALDYTGDDWWDDYPSLVAHPSDGNTLLLAVRSLGVMRSANGGASWVKVDNWVSASNRMVTWLAWAPSNPTVLYAEAYLPGNQPMRTWKSVDAGLTWREGVTINEFHQGRFDMSLAVDPVDHNRVIIANTYMSESVDGLASTRQIPRPPHADHLQVAFAPSAPQVVYNGNDGGTWKSIDGGRNWVRCDVGAETNLAFGFAVDPVTGVIYLSSGDYASGIIYTPGRGWRDMDGGYEWQQFYINPHDRNDVYLAGSIGLHRVGNPTRPWQKIDPAPNENRPYRAALRFHPTDPNIIYLGLQRIYKSPDRGSTWQKIEVDSALAQRGEQVWHFQVAPSDPQTIYAFMGGTAKLYVTRNGGASWTADRDFYGSSYIAVHPQDARRLFIPTFYGLFLSTDGGVNIQKVAGFPDGLTVEKMIFDPSNNSHIFAATSAGVLVSEDGGTNWARLGMEMPPAYVGDIALVNRELYATSYMGMWVMKLNGLPACSQPAVVTPTQVQVGSSGGIVTIEVSAVRGSCSWTATSGSGWARVKTNGQNQGSAMIDLVISSNTGATRRTELNIAGQVIPVAQYGGDDPLLSGTKVAISNSSGCLEVSGLNLQQKPCSGQPNQQFLINHITGNVYAVASAGATICMDVANGSQRAGDGVDMYPCHYGDNQLFLIEQVSDSAWRIINKRSFLCLTSDGGQFTQQVSDGAAAQQFNLQVLSRPLAVVTTNAAHYGKESLATESIVAAFGSRLATGTFAVTALPLPTSLAGTVVKVKDSLGNERSAQLFYVAPTQVNYLIPSGMAAGAATVTITSGDGTSSVETLLLSSVAPGIFSAEASGAGLAAGLILRVKANGSQYYEPIVRYDEGQKKYVAIPVDLGSSSDQVFLLLFGTGIRHRFSLPSVGVRIGGVDSEVLYAGSQSEFAGLDQINVRIPKSLSGRGLVNVALSAEGVPANTVTISIK